MEPVWAADIVDCEGCKQLEHPRRSIDPKDVGRYATFRPFDLVRLAEQEDEP
jgi:hypothetical protein